MCTPAIWDLVGRMFVGISLYGPGYKEAAKLVDATVSRPEAEEFDEYKYNDFLQLADTRIQDSGLAIGKVDAKLLGIKNSLKNAKARDQQRLKAEAMKLLKEKNRLQAVSNSWQTRKDNISAVRDQIVSTKDSADYIRLIAESRVMANPKHLGIAADKIQRLMDEMQEGLDSTNEIQEKLGSTFTNEKFTEADLAEAFDEFMQEEEPEEATPAAAARRAPPPDSMIVAEFPQAPAEAPQAPAPRRKPVAVKSEMTQLGGGFSDL